MPFFEEAAKFLYSHDVDTARLKLHDGYFICPHTYSNEYFSETKPSIILHDITFVDFFKDSYPNALDSLKYFLNINDISYDQLDQRKLFSYFSLIEYFISGVNHLEENNHFQSVEDFMSSLSIEKIKSFYENVLLHTMNKGLSEITSKNIIFGTNIDHSGIENILDILNSELKKISFTNNLMYTVSDFNGLNHFAGFIGEKMEQCVRKNYLYVHEEISQLFGSNKGVILDFDGNRSILSSLKKYKGLKIPDFIYFDNLGNVLPLDAKVELEYAKFKQVSKENLIIAFEKINFKKKIKKVSF
jgi:hypothetical protein